MVLPPKNMALPLKNFVKIKASPPKNSTFFYSTPKEILNFYNLPLENSLVFQPEGAGIKCNSPFTFSPLRSTGRLGQTAALPPS